MPQENKNMNAATAATPATGMNRRLKAILQLAVCVAVPLALGFASSLLAGDIRGSYEAMRKPPLSPPGGVFGIVWAVLYAAMGVSLFLVLRAKATRRAKTGPVAVFIAQLLLNFSWSIVFFRAGALWVALVIIIVMDLLVLLCIPMFYRLQKLAALLLCPYLAWLLFATYLNIGFAVLN